MRKVECGRIEPLLPLAAGGDLTAAQSLLVERHLGSCEDCRRSLEGFEATVHTIRELPASPFSSEENAELRRTVWSRIETERRGRAPVPGWLNISWKSAAWAAAAVAVVALLLPWRPTRPSGSPAPARQAIATIPPPDAGSRPKPEPHPPAAAPRIARRRAPSRVPADPEPAQPVRIELSTPDPDVRIVWLVGPVHEDLPLLPDVFAIEEPASDIPPDATKEDSE